MCTLPPFFGFKENKFVSRRFAVNRHPRPRRENECLHTRVSLARTVVGQTLLSPPSEKLPKSATPYAKMMQVLRTQKVVIL